MSLFGAATTGVDPTTGSYLSKEQRVAMFQASRGRGGGGSGTPSGGEKKGGVAPQNAIVVANKMAAVVQTLQTNTQETVQAVNVKVQENAQNIENLYKSVQTNRAAEAQQEKAETKLLRGEREAELRKGKEKLIEGLSSAVAGLASMGRRAAEAAMAPAMGFWEKLKQFLLQLGMAFLIKNLPFIVGKIEEFGNWLGDFKNWFPESLTSLRGVWSIADNIIRMMWRGFRGFAGRVYRGATWLAGELYNIGKKIFTTIGNFIKNVVGDLASYVSNAFKTAWNKLSNAFDDAWKGLKGWWNNRGGGGGTPSAPGSGGGGNKALSGAADEAGGGIGAWVGKQWNRLSNWGKGVYSRGQEFLEQGGKAISGQLGKIQEGMTGVKPQSAPKRLGWIEDALAPLIKRFPDMSGALSGLGKMFAGVSKAIPLIGFAIDLALNKNVAGQDWTEAIIRALGSSIAGGVSATVGAKIGAGIGGSVGAAALGIGAVPGAAIGAALGAIIAGVAGGWLGDQAGALTYEGITGETRTENKPENNQNLTIEASGEQGLLHDPSKKENIQVQVKGTDGMVSTATNGASTPEGMQEPDGGAGRNTAEVVELDPQVVDARAGDDDEEPEIPGMIEEVPFWETSDPSADIYRSIASREYELTY